MEPDVKKYLIIAGLSLLTLGWISAGFEVVSVIWPVSRLNAVAVVAAFTLAVLAMWEEWV